MFFKKNQNKTDSYCTKKNSCEKLSSYDKSGNVYKNILNPGNVSIINEKNLEATVMGQEPWPEDAKLFQPYETEQILLPDSANCLAVQAFLKMCQLNYTVEYKVNAEEMSPSGKVPFIKCGAYLISELESITNFVASKGISLTSNLDESQKADMRAYMSLVNIVLGNAENYVTWCDNETYLKVTKPRYGSVHPFPLNHILCYLKRKSILKRLAVYGWADKTLDKVYDEVDRGCSALSERLEKSRFFFGDKPCEVDATLFAHVYTILTWPSFPAGIQLADVIRKHIHLVNHCKSLMHLLNLTEDIDKPSYNKMYLNQVLGDPMLVSEGNNEFVYSENESRFEGQPQEEQDYSCMMNEENQIYDALFSKNEIFKRVPVRSSKLN
ncbi:metaxin-2-like isoform X1 [Cimex lectularius]|uniref:Metaxin-2 n=1 Tax=Cimex lectularius TaxID=79782 RepID=A0A8I6SD95_CIMLE|nr:metaxin-2-like isoform X1 [Cimex lectularius]